MDTIPLKPPFDHKQAGKFPGPPPFHDGKPPMHFPQFGPLSGPPPMIDEPPVDVSHIKTKYLDVPYDGASEAQKVDIFLPDTGDGPFPVLIHIHGGGFGMGDKRDGHIVRLLECLKKGYAFASINYRLSAEAIFPAAVLDCRRAIGFLKENAGKYALDPARFGVIGGSAGGNLCAMMAMNIPYGDFPSEKNDSAIDCSVKAAVDMFGPTDFFVMDEQARQNGVSIADHFEPYSAESTYLGGPLMEVDPEVVRKANPMTYISEKMCPLLVEHGRLDRMVPYQQSEILVKAIEEKLGKGRVTFITLDTADHDDPQYETDENMEIIWSFLGKHLAS